MIKSKIDCSSILTELKTADDSIHTIAAYLRILVSQESISDETCAVFHTELDFLGISHRAIKKEVAIGRVIPFTGDDTATVTIGGEVDNAA